MPIHVPSQAARRAAATVKDLAVRYKEEHIQVGFPTQGEAATLWIDKPLRPRWPGRRGTPSGAIPLGAAGPSAELLFRSGNFQSRNAMR